MCTDEKACIRCCSCCCIIILLFIGWILSFGQENADLLGVVGENLRTPFISDVQFGNGPTCPHGMYAQNLAAWPGTYQGCYCAIGSTLSYGECQKDNWFFASNLSLDDSDHFPLFENVDSDITLNMALNYDKLLADPAQKKLFIQTFGCKDVNPTSAYLLRIWRGRSICVRYYAEDDYYLSSSGCNHDFQPCQHGLCVKSGLKCPVTSIEFQRDNSFIVVRDTTKPGLLKFQITEEGEYPCLNNYREPRTANYSYYPLLRQPDDCGKYGNDNSSILVDNELLTDLYMDNGIGFVVSNLPKYPSYIAKRRSSLFARQRLQINYENVNCLTLDWKHFHKSSSGSNEQKEYLKKIIEWNCFSNPHIKQVIQDLTN